VEQVECAHAGGGSADATEVIGRHRQELGVVTHLVLFPEMKIDQRPVSLHQRVAQLLRLPTRSLAGIAPEEP
jgi:hypothetical protein